MERDRREDGGTHLPDVLLTLPADQEGEEEELVESGGGETDRVGVGRGEEVEKNQRADSR